MSTQAYSVEFTIVKLSHQNTCTIFLENDSYLDFF